MSEEQDINAKLEQAQAEVASDSMDTSNQDPTNEPQVDLKESQNNQPTTNSSAPMVEPAYTWQNPRSGGGSINLRIVGIVVVALIAFAGLAFLLAFI